MKLEHRPNTIQQKKTQRQTNNRWMDEVYRDLEKLEVTN
jgi:hypothetical protein